MHHCCACDCTSWAVRVETVGHRRGRFLVEVQQVQGWGVEDSCRSLGSSVQPDVAAWHEPLLPSQNATICIATCCCTEQIHWSVQQHGPAMRPGNTSEQSRLSGALSHSHTDYTLTRSDGRRSQDGPGDAPSKSRLARGGAHTRAVSSSAAGLESVSSSFRTCGRCILRTSRSNGKKCSGRSEVLVQADSPAVLRMRWNT